MAQSIEQMMAEFAARGGQIKKAAPGQRALTERQVYLAAHASDWEKEEERKEQQARVRKLRDEDDRITVVTDHAGREFYRNSEGEWL